MTETNAFLDSDAGAGVAWHGYAGLGLPPGPSELDVTAHEPQHGLPGDSVAPAPRIHPELRFDLHVAAIAPIVRRELPELVALLAERGGTVCDTALYLALKSRRPKPQPGVETLDYEIGQLEAAELIAAIRAELSQTATA